MSWKSYIIMLNVLAIISVINATNCYNPLDTLFNGSQFNTSFYCQTDVILYPVSNYTLSHFQQLHNAAQNFYMQVANRWWMKQYSGNAEPDNDCIGIARQVVCAYTFSAFEDVGDVNAICGWLCDLWAIRCPTEVDMYNMMCFNARRDGYCTSEERLTLKASLIIFFLFNLFFIF